MYGSFDYDPCYHEIQCPPSLDRRYVLVRQRPCLYDAKDPLNKNKIEKDRNWKEIASTLNVSDELTRSKWRNLKDTYSKHLKSKKCPKNHPAAKYTHWQWAPHMAFMKKHLCVTLVDDLDTQSQSSSDVQVTEKYREGTQIDQRSTEKAPVLMQRRRRLYMSRQEKNLCTNSDRVLQYKDHDATELIFLGYAKTIKSFSIRRQAQIKMKIAKIMMEEEVAHFEESCGNSDYSYSPQHDGERDPLLQSGCRGSAPGSFSGETFCPEMKIER